jgi:HSP20 family protein
MTVHEQKAFLPTLAHQATEVFAPLQREIDRVMSDFSRSLGAADVFSPTLDMDYAETPEAVELSFDVPGLTDKDLKVVLEDGILTVSGEKKAKSESKDKNRRLVERRYGAFTRSVRLPSSVETNRVKATLENGVLTVTAPKNHADAGRTIKIEQAKA